jgi:hypothetical protein
VATWGALCHSGELTASQKNTVLIFVITSSEEVMNIYSHEGKYFKIQDAQMSSLHTLTMFTGQLNWLRGIFLDH